MTMIIKTSPAMPTTDMEVHAALMTYLVGRKRLLALGMAPNNSVMNIPRVLINLSLNQRRPGVESGNVTSGQPPIGGFLSSAHLRTSFGQAWQECAGLVPAQEAIMADTSEFIMDAARGGLHINHLVTGKLARCKVENDRGGQLSGWYRYFDDGAPGGVWGNWKTGETGTWSSKPALTFEDALEQRARIKRVAKERDEQQRNVWAGNLRRNVELWATGRPITAGDPVARYLASRGIQIPNTEALCYAPKVAYYEDGQYLGHFPAMLGALTNSDGALVCVHRTFLTAEGKKADVSCPRKLMPSCGPVMGASIKLGSPVPHRGGVMLGVAEGIETALAVTMLYGLPCWSAVSASGMEKGQLPAGITSLFVMGDNDRNGVGQQAAHALAKRAASMGITARACIAPSPGTDWNDELLARRSSMNS